MDSLEKRIEKLEYYNTLLINMVEANKYPFYRLIMERGLSKEETQEVYSLCNELSKLHEEQKAQGLVIFTDLLAQFANKLNTKLKVDETIHAMVKQGLYSPLMIDFLKLMK